MTRIRPTILLSFASWLLWLVTCFTLVSAGTNQAGLDYLAAKRKEPDVLEHRSGFLYKVLKKGTGKYYPAVSTSCSCHYEGKLIDGTVFDSSYERGEPTTFAPNQVIKGWTEAMQSMVEGDKWELYLPSEMAYGDRGSPPKIGGGEVLVFQMEILEILSKDGLVLKLSCNPTTLEDCTEKEQAWIKTTVADWSLEKKKNEMDRLKKILTSSKQKMKEDLVDWIKRRINILEQFTEEQSGESEEL